MASTVAPVAGKKMTNPLRQTGFFLMPGQPGESESEMFLLLCECCLQSPAEFGQVIFFIFYLFLKKIY